MTKRRYGPVLEPTFTEHNIEPMSLVRQPVKPPARIQVNEPPVFVRNHPPPVTPNCWHFQSSDELEHENSTS